MLPKNLFPLVGAAFGALSLLAVPAQAGSYMIGPHTHSPTGTTSALTLSSIAWSIWATRGAGARRRERNRVPVREAIRGEVFNIVPT